MQLSDPFVPFFPFTLLSHMCVLIKRHTKQVETVPRAITFVRVSGLSNIFIPVVTCTVSALAVILQLCGPPEYLTYASGPQSDLSCASLPYTNPSGLAIVSCDQEQLFRVSGYSSVSHMVGHSP